MTQRNWTQMRSATFDRQGALQMDRIAKTVFKPIYPVIARNALEAAGICCGSCLDLGTGPGLLAMAMVEAAPGMSVTAFDFSEDALGIAEDNFKAAGLDDRIAAAFGDVHDLPFDDHSVDLIVSRGSMFFWQDLEAAFAEIYRILAPGGATYIGGGFGSLALKEQVIRDMARVDPAWDCYARKKTGDDGHARFGRMFSRLGCSSWQIIDDDTGFWILLSNPV